MVTLLAIALAAAQPASPWDGSWRLDAARSSPGAKDAAAGAYRFHIAGRAIRWEIPELGEVVTGRTDGQPMTIRRRGKSDGTTLAVSADGPWTLHYRVAKDGRAGGGGVMMLVEQGRAWVDISWGPKGQPEAAQLLYVRER